VGLLLLSTALIEDPFTENQDYQRHFDETGPEVDGSVNLPLKILPFSIF
jgi:hypothetical protein